MQIKNRWWEHATPINFFNPKSRGLELTDITAKLDEIKEWGFTAVWMGIPYHGGVQYYGLDVIDYYSVDPALGTMADFEQLISEAHSRGLQVLACLNLGYAALDFPPFLKACDDVKAGVDSPESRWFVWSDSRHAELDRSRVPYFMNDVDGYWHYSDRAGKYYWVKWSGEKGDVSMPNFNYGDPGWQEECRKVVRFWMETGVDGLIVDAVNWYTDCTWEINNSTISDVVHERPGTFVLPEGGGGFSEDPVEWVTTGHYDSVMDYGLSCWWLGRDVIARSLKNQSPWGIEGTLRQYRDRVVAAGGVSWAECEWARKDDADLPLRHMLLDAALRATAGEMFTGHMNMLGLPWPPEQLAQLKGLIKARSEYPALGALGKRTQVPTYNNKLYYAYLRSTPEGDQEMLVVFNFQDEARIIRVYLERPADLTEIFTKEKQSVSSELQLSLPPFGFAIYEVSH